MDGACTGHEHARVRYVFLGARLIWILGVVIQQLRRSKNRRRPGRHGCLRPARDVGLEDRLMICAEGFFECLAMARQQIDAELLSIGEDVTASVTITFGELGDQLFDAGLCHREDQLFIALLDRDLLAEPLLEYSFEVGC